MADATGSGGADHPASVGTLKRVIDRGRLNCGVTLTRSPFGSIEDDGTVAGLDVEFCKAIAAAVLGDPTRVELVGISDPATGFGMLHAGSVDILFSAITITAAHDREWRVDFARPIFYTGHGLAVRTESRFRTTADLAEETICVQSGRTTEQYLADHFTGLGVWYYPLGGLLRDVLDAFFAGRCDALSADASYLATAITGRVDAADYRILAPLITREPLAPAVREDDSEWRDLINWIANGLIAAEELRITRANVEHSAADPASIDIARLLGASYEGGEVATFGFDPLSPQFIQRAIAAVGNYGEIYDRTIGDVITRACSLNALAIDDSVDCPPGQGGIMYALPYR